MRRIMSPWIALALTAFGGIAVSGGAGAQSLPAADREAIVRLYGDRGGRADDMVPLLSQVDEATAKGLPAAPLMNKIREGLAKGVALSRIAPLIRQMTTYLESADRLMRELTPASTANGRMASVILLADAFGSGVTEDEVRALRQQAQASGAPPLSADDVASAAKALALIKDAGLPAAEGAAVVAEAARRGFRAQELLDLGREIRRREQDFQTGRASLRDLRDAISRGDRGDRLFREARPERPTATRPATGAERPQRPERPVPPERPQRP